MHGTIRDACESFRLNLLQKMMHMMWVMHGTTTWPLQDRASCRSAEWPGTGCCFRTEGPDDHNPGLLQRCAISPVTKCAFGHADQASNAGVLATGLIKGTQVLPGSAAHLLFLYITR